ncbi:MAG: A/G-specific adenine glycosylase [Clostridia bacterium]|nr:A/G-specific adenine glycosylase [Clostridia bacterium]
MSARSKPPAKNGLAAKESRRLSPAVPALLDWFSAGKRWLPWREAPTPYRVWVSEIMLQQTRIEAVLPYFERFMKDLPNIPALSRVSPDRLMKLWEGLGYYSRARHLQAAAQIVTAQYGGSLPPDYDALRALPGIGDYTAGAIASIAFGLPTPAVDGNVLRVLARLTGSREDITRPAVRREMTALAAALLPRDHPGEFNQALMELGERVCLPNTMPDCDRCPLSAVCAVGHTPDAAELPVRAPKKTRRIENRTVFVVLSDEPQKRVLLHRRPPSGLLAGLWELPNTLHGALPPELPIDGEPVKLTDSRHIFSHIEWYMTGYAYTVAPFAPPPGYEWVSAAALQTDRALPTAFRAYAQHLPEWLAVNREECV